MNNMSNQKERIKAAIDKDIREILQFEITNNCGFFTVSRIDVTDDLSYVRVYVSFFEHPQDNFEKLQKTKGFVRSSLAKKLNLRRSPDIGFILDDGFFKEKRIEDILKQNKDDADTIDFMKN